MMITVKQAAEVAGVSRQLIRRQLANGRVKGELIDGKVWLVDEASLRAWMNQPRKAGNPNWKPKAAKE